MILIKKLRTLGALLKNLHIQENSPRSDALSFSSSPWYGGLQPNIDAEIPIQICLKDLCKPGNTVFDVGANIGALTMICSRLVGPKGCVCAFEASPNTVEKLQSNMIRQGCANVMIFDRAVYSRSNVALDFFIIGEGSQADSLYLPPSAKE
jgi:hypothetical protein